MRCGLLGRRLGHSYSPTIHRHFGYAYELIEKEPEELEAFLKAGAFTGLNVTIPYKKAVIPYLNGLSDIAQRLGAVNTIVRTPNDKLLGHNSDFFGFSYLLQTSDFSVKNRKALVLGSGGASATVCAVLREQGAKVVVISRTGENNYENLHLHRDAALLVNTTPVGMYPDTGASPVDLSRFPQLTGVLDVIYNPARTALLLQAQALGIPCAGGLPMLVAQAWESAQWFTGREIPLAKIEEILQDIEKNTLNIVLIGMPGCGKSTVGRLLAQRLHRPFADADEEIEKKAGMTIPEIFETYGQAHFRRLETEVLENLGKQSGLVIACGGGAVTESRNAPLLRQNGKIIWLLRDIHRLPSQGRPLSLGTDLYSVYALREPMYRQFADLTADNNGSLEETINNILEVCL